MFAKLGSQLWPKESISRNTKKMHQSLAPKVDFGKYMKKKERYGWVDVNFIFCIKLLWSPKWRSGGWWCLWKSIECPITQVFQYLMSCVASGVCNECVAKLMISFEAKQDNTCYSIYFSILKTWALENIPPDLLECYINYQLLNFLSVFFINYDLWHCLMSQ